MAETEHSVTITALCENCGEVIEVKDARAYILALHLTLNCESLKALREDR